MCMDEMFCVLYCMLASYKGPLFVPFVNTHRALFNLLKIDNFGFSVYIRSVEIFRNNAPRHSCYQCLYQLLSFTCELGVCGMIGAFEFVRWRDGRFIDLTSYLDRQKRTLSTLQWRRETMFFWQIIQEFCEEQSHICATFTVFYEAKQLTTEQTISFLCVRLAMGYVFSGVLWQSFQNGAKTLVWTETVATYR